MPQTQPIVPCFFRGEEASFYGKFLLHNGVLWRLLLFHFVAADVVLFHPAGIDSVFGLEVYPAVLFVYRNEKGIWGKEKTSSASSAGLAFMEISSSFADTSRVRTTEL